MLLPVKQISGYVPTCQKINGKSTRAGKLQLVHLYRYIQGTVFNVDAVKAIAFNAQCHSCCQNSPTISDTQKQDFGILSQDSRLMGRVLSSSCCKSQTCPSSGPLAWPRGVCSKLGVTVRCDIVPMLCRITNMSLGLTSWQCIGQAKEGVFQS